MKFLQILTVIILLLFPFGELLRFDLGNYVAWKPLDVLIFFTVGLWIILFRKKIQKQFKFKYILFPLVGLISLIVNLYWLKNTEAVTSFLYLLRWVMYAGMFLVVREFSPSFKQKIKLLLLFDGAAMVVFGFLQYFFYNSLRNLNYLGWDDHLHRVFSTFLDPNFTGGFFVLYFIFTAGMLIQHLRKPLVKNHGRFIFWSLGITLFATLIAVFLTFSRSSLLMLLFSSVIFLILIGKKKLIVGVFLMLVLFGVIVSPKFYDENMNLFRVRSSVARLDNYSVALRIIADRPIVGVGFNTYRYTKKLYGLPHEWVSAPSHADSGVDNSFLFVLATTGLVGFGAYLYLWSLILKKAAFIYRQNKNTVSLILLSSAGGLAIHAMFVNSLFFGPIMLWMWIVIALTEEN